MEDVDDPTETATDTKENPTSLEILEAKTQLRELVDAFANLADEKRISDQMPLFTPDTKVQVHMGDDFVFDISDTTQLEETFTALTANVKRSSHMNGQHDVQTDGDTATGIAYCQVKLVSNEGDHEVIQDSHIRYDDTYIRQDGTWLVATRISHVNINEKRVPQRLTTEPDRVSRSPELRR